MNQHTTTRRCAAPDCDAILSRYNDGEHCAAHRGLAIEDHFATAAASAAKIDAEWERAMARLPYVRATYRRSEESRERYYAQRRPEILEPGTHGQTEPWDRRYFSQDAKGYRQGCTARKCTGTAVVRWYRADPEELARWESYCPDHIPAEPARCSFVACAEIMAATDAAGHCAHRDGHHTTRERNSTRA